jgi:HEPN domain-containing protein
MLRLWRSARDWFRQAEADLRHARTSKEAGDYDWAAFASQQAAEKAIKALFQHLHLEAWIHVLSALRERTAKGILPLDGIFVLARASRMGGGHGVMLHLSPRIAASLSIAPGCIAIALLFLTCLLSEVLPRFLLPSWILLFAAAVLAVAGAAEVVLKRVVSIR